MAPKYGTPDKLFADNLGGTMTVEWMYSEFLLRVSKRFNFRGNVADLDFSIDRHRPFPFFKWWGWIYLSVMSDMAYFHFRVYPFDLTLWRYDNL
jgi:hypothetical protein